MKILNRGLVAVLALAAASCASADTIVTYTVSGSGYVDMNPHLMGSLSGLLTVDQTAGVVKSLDFTAVGLGPLAAIIAGTTPSTPGLTITNPAPGKIVVDLPGPDINQYIVDIETMLNLTASNPFTKSLSGTYSGSIQVPFGGDPFVLSGSATLYPVPEPNFGWLAGGLLSVGLLYGARRRVFARVGC